MNVDAIPARLSIPTLEGAETPLDHALQLVGAGLHCVLVHAPVGDQWCTCKRDNCQARGKHPIAKSWQKKPLAEEQQVRDAFALYSFTPNLGIILGEQQQGAYLVAIDVDDAERFAELEVEYGALPETPRSDSARGYRLLFTLPSDTAREQVKNITALGGKSGVDVKVRGGQIVIAPSLHPTGVRYTWSRTGVIMELPPAWVLAILSRPVTPQWAENYTPQRMRDDRRTAKRAEAYLETSVLREARLMAAAGKGLRNTTLYTSLCRLLPLAQSLLLPMGTGFVVRELSRAAAAAGLPEREIRTTVASAEKWLQESGAVRMPFALSEPVTGANMNGQPAPQEPPAPESPIELILDNGVPAKCATNVARLLSEHGDWRGGPRFDQFTSRVEWPAPVPVPLQRIQRLSQALVDQDEVAIQGWLFSQPYTMRVRAGIDIVSDGVRQAAHWSAYDSLRARIESLPPWDQVERVDTWLVNYAGAKDAPVTRVFGRRWIISAIARGLTPGCVADGALVLEGEQGIGKNRLITAIFGDAPWVQSIGSYRIGHDVEADRIAGSAWVVHDDEMKGRRSELDALKSWISRREDTYRAPYERNLQTRPRRAVLVCSTNRPTYLEDTTNRRFWPVKCGRIDWVGAARDAVQLLSEAFLLYRRGEPWTISLSDPLWGDVESEQDERRVTDPVVTNVLNALGVLQSPEEVTISQLADQIGLSPAEIDRSMETRYGLILRDAGYFRVRTMREGVRCYVYRKKVGQVGQVGQS